MGGRGSGSGAGLGRGRAPKFTVVSTTSLVSEREGRRQEVDDVLTVSRDMNKNWGLEIADLEIATLKGRDADGVLAYYSRGTGSIAINRTYFDAQKMGDAYAECVALKFHPPLGNKTAMQATAAHELGHALNDMAASKMGLGFDAAATRIVTEAVPNITTERAIANISGYAGQSNAECIAEAVADVYCNGQRANADSLMIVQTLRKYIKR